MPVVPIKRISIENNVVIPRNAYDALVPVLLNGPLSEVTGKSGNRSGFAQFGEVARVDQHDVGGTGGVLSPLSSAATR